jgi:hypothetical protein
MPKSLLNNRIYPLAAGETFIGLAEATAIETGQWTAISVSVAVPSACTLTIEQTYNKTNWFVTETTTLEPDVLKIVQQAITLPYFRVKLENLGTLQTYCHLVSSLVANLTQDLNIRSLETGRDNVLISGEDSIGAKHTLLTDASGALVVISSGSAPVGTQDVNIVSPNPLPVSGLVTITSDTSSVQAWAEDTASGDYFVLSSTSEVRDARTYHKLETYDYTANNTLTSIDTKVGLQGQNTDFVFIPDATNLTPDIYADEQPPYLTTSAGWLYTNTNPQKINWYVFQDPVLPQYLVSEMDSIYCVVSQLTPATALPYIVFSTMPNGINDAVPNFAKSVLVFAPSGAVPTAQGEYLLYVKSDPVHIRPEITNRYELTYVAGQSTKTLEQASGERLSLASIQTDSGAATGAYYFLFQQYGLTWAKTSVPLPVNNGKVECNVTLQPVTLAPSTSDIGYTRLKAEDRTNPGSFLNLLGYDAGAGFNLLVKDEEAGSILSSIDTHLNTIESTLTSIDTATDDIVRQTAPSNGASTKTLTQTGANWTNGDSTLQSLTLSNVGGLVFSYVKLYNKASAPDQNDTPVMTLPLNHETVQQVVCNSLRFNLGIGVRATNAFVANDNTTPSGVVYATAFYKLG